MSGGKARKRKQKKYVPKSRIGSICVNCGEPGPHFIPPGFGSPEMFMCKKRSGDE